MKNMHFQNILICFMVAVTLAACAPASDKKAMAVDGPVSTQPDVIYTELSPDQINRECTKEEVDVLKHLDASLENLSKAIDKNKGEKDDEVLQAGQDAVMACDQVIEGLGVAQACRITVKNIIMPNNPKISYYDQYRVDQKCKKTENYLVKFGVRPSKNQTPQQPPIAQPPVVKPPVVTPPAGSSRQCSKEEFTKLSQGLSAADAATKLIDKLGATWKYESATIAQAALGTKACENLIAYHDQQPCERTIDKVLKQYNNVTLRQRCEKARTYFYEYVQNSKTLNFKNADLFLDVSGFSDRKFEAGYINEIQGCRIENITERDIDYSSKNLVLIKSSRGFEAKMMVLETAEGLLVQCYGLNIDGPFSKREVVKVLKEEGTNMPLVYKLK